MNLPERMDDFFAKRVDFYDEHMINEVEGCKQGYVKMASLVPQETKTLLDLGCGTGLELDEIFKALPDISVVGIDLTQQMLTRLRQKHPTKNLKLICADYFAVDLGCDRFDCAVSFQTMHHFSHEKKTELYKKVCTALKTDGVYIECDYMVESQQEEDFYFAENERMRKQHAVPEGVLCHYDTPCTVENQIKMLKTAGFKTVEKVFRIENTTMIVAYK